MNNHHILFGKGAYGIRIWEIWSEGDTIKIRANGQEYSERIHTGKAGRSLPEQIALRIKARVRNKLDNGFKYSREEADQMMTNQMNLPLPMLAKQHKDVKHDLLKCFIQPKLDGHRCLITKDDDGKVLAYSRRGKPIETIDHILSTLDIPDGIVLDGELYCHGESLQTIASWAKRFQSNSRLLSFHVYDLIPMYDEKMPYIERYNYLKDIKRYNEKLEIVRTFKANNRDDLEDIFIETVEQGYEGLILRPEKGVYGIGKRSNDLLKVKQRIDKEFKCVDIITSRDGWGVLILQAENGKLFRSLAPGTVHEKLQIVNKKEKYIGKYVTCEFAGYTDEGIPFHAACTRWRIDL